MIKMKNILYEALAYQLYCDMDGVLTNFDADFMKLSNGIPCAEYEKLYGGDKFWDLINRQGLKFWSEMHWMPDGKKLWKYIKPLNAKILSAPPKNPTANKLAKQGKVEWTTREIGVTNPISVYAEDKTEVFKQKFYTY